MPAELVASLRPSAKRPEQLHDDAAPPTLCRGRYGRRYAMTGSTGQCLVQRVSVRIHYSRGPHTLASYRQTYYEFFQFDQDEQSIVDVHDFDYSRDGWRPAVLTNLFKHHGIEPGALRGVAGDPVLKVTKTFVLATGTVRGALPQHVAGGGKFGILEGGPDGPSRVEMRLKMPGSPAVAVAGLAAYPRHLPASGQGYFADAVAWRTSEHLRLHYASNSASVAGAPTYRQARLSLTSVRRQTCDLPT